MAAAQEQGEPLHSSRVRNHLARLLGYLPVDAAVPPLVNALQDLEVREMARQSLECHPSPRATDALIAALNSTGPVFCAGVINSLAKKGGAQSLAAVRRATDDPQAEVRFAALTALSAFPDASLDAILERHNAYVARVRLAETLRAAGNKAAAERIYKAILAGNAPEPQKRAARLGLQSS
jgi:HEAT repeat protein